MKSKHLLLMLLLALVVPWAANAQTQNATLYNGTDYNSYVPMYTSYCDNGFTSEYIIPASAFENENIYPGSLLHSITLYQKQTNPWVAKNLTVKLTNTDTESYSSAGLLGSSGTTVYTNASYSANSAESHTYEFSSSFEYTGGSLIVQISAASGGTWKSSSWYGTTTTTTDQGYFIYSSYTGSLQKFIPKTTFNYTPGTAPATPKPTNFAVSNILHNQAELSWTENGTATSWQICVNDDETNLITITDNPYTLTGLTPQTAYTVKVRSVGTPNSDWSSSKSFTTTAQATAVGDSWSDDFEGTECGWDLINGTLTNKWCWGTAVNNGGTHSLYVSKDSGATNTYTGSNTKIFAAKLLNFTEGKFNFSFDWKCQGENGYDFIRVALVPASQTLTAGTDYSTIGSSSLPTGWIAVDGGNQLHQQGSTTPTWQNKEATVNVSAGNYYLVLVWRNDTGIYDPAAAVDNVSITRMACPYDVENLAVATEPAVTETTATVTWTAGEAEQWQVAYSTNSNFEGATQEIVSTASYNMTGLTANTKYYVKVRAYCGGEDYGTWCNAISFYTECPQYTTIPPEGWTVNFDDMTGTTSGTTNNLPHCWNYINESGNSTYQGYPVVYNASSYSNSPNNHLRFYSYLYYNGSSTTTSDPKPQYVILPKMQNVNGLRIKLYARAYNTGTNYDASFKVGIMSDPDDANTFELIDTKTPASTTYEQFVIPFNNYTGTGTYIAIMIDAAEGAASAYASYYHSVLIDDITVEEIPSCLEPTIIDANNITSTTADLSWTAGGSETAWDIFLTDNPFAQPASYTLPTVTGTTTNPHTLTELTPATKYYAFVRARCSATSQSEWSEVYSFTTECEARTIDADHHYRENFNDYTTDVVTSTTPPTTYPNHQLPYCWQFLNLSENTNTYPMVFISSYSSYSVSGNCLFFKSSSTTPLYAILPEFTNDISDLMLTFTYRNEGTNSSNGTLYVSYMTDPTDATTFNTEHAVAYDRTTTLTEKEVFFENAPAGSYIAFKYQGGTSNNMYLSIDNVTVEPAPTCRKPSGLTKDATTAHTATLHWTNGTTDQDAWQIAYSTTANFNPDEVTPVDVTTNPATIEGLAQSTTYYAYVRAYCGGTDYSAWNSTKVTFSTVAGNVTPTGLAVANNTITSSQATASWNAVAGNTLHEYYQIYWAEATVTSVPDEPAAPNLITNITATSQPITGLNPETSYKVWVRDICGDDGNSAWSSAVTFTTAAECQTPDGLAASNVTNESATITWNTYGQEGFNLQYRISGEEWDANNIIPNVSTPYTLNPPLIGSTTYQVRVQAACTTDDSWSSALSFKTQCDHVPFPWSENFDDWESKSECWSFLSGQYNHGNGPATTSSSAWALNDTYGSHITLSGKALTMNLYSTYKYWAVTPVIDITTDDALLTVDVAVAAWSSATPNYDNNDTLAFAISTDGGATFTSLRELDGAELNTLSNSYTTIYVPVTGYNGQAVRFAIFGGSINNVSSNNDNRCVIDNVTVGEVPSCYPVGTLSAATNVTYNSAKLSWALVDDTQDEWTVQYATNATFTEGVETKTATINTNYELTGLTPETHYWVRVKAACSETDDWSNAVDFETEVFCAVSVPTATNITQTTADLSWTGESDSYNIQYRTAAVPTTTQLFTEGFETYADESALEAVWTVRDLGDGENTAELGLYDGAKKTGNYGFRFSSYDGSSSGDFDQYLISPELTKAGLLEFAYKSSSGTSDKFRVGYSSTTNDVSAFTWGAETNSASSWKTYSETMPEDAKYFAINYTAVYQFRLYIDDIAIYEVQDAGTWQNTTSETASKQLTGLAAGTKYDVQVQGVCGGTAGSWSTPVYSFTTLPFTKVISGYGSGNGGYYLIASPLADDVNPTKVGGMITDNLGGNATPATSTYDLYSFDQAQNLEWLNYRANAFDLVNGQGYLYASKEGTTLTFAGEVGTNGTVTLNLTSGVEFEGCNLVGNPFGVQAYISKHYYRMAEGGAEIMSTYSSDAINVMEGVFVIADENDEELTFSTTPNSIETANLNLNLSQANRVIDRAIVSFGKGEQLPKFQLNKSNTKVYIPVEGKDYAIANAESNVGEIPVSFEAKNNGTYTLSFTNEEVSFAYLHLIDNMTGIETDLLANPSYTFEARTTDYASRFKLVFATGSSTGSDTFAYYSNGNWVINNEGRATLQVVDVNGRILKSESINGCANVNFKAAAGIYMIRLVNGDNVKVQKVVVK